MFLMPFGCRRTAAEEGCRLTGSHSCRRFWKVGWCSLFAPSGLIRGEKRGACKKQKDYEDEKHQSYKLIQHLQHTQVILQKSTALRLQQPECLLLQGGRMQLTASSSSTACNLLFCFGEFFEKKKKGKKLPTLHQLSHRLFSHRKIKRFQLSMNSSRGCQPIWGLTAAVVDRLLRTNEQTLQMIAALFSKTRDCLKW